MQTNRTKETNITEYRHSNKIFRVRIRGDYACFTRAELKTERVSYELITPSAARGIIEAVFWKPAMKWCIRRIFLLKQPGFIQFRRNELRTFLSTSNAIKDMNASLSGRPCSSRVAIYTDSHRSQRNMLALRGVDYAVEAEIQLTDMAEPEDTLTKFQEMFLRRLRRGQQHYQPYLGCREFPAIVEEYTGNPKPVRTGPVNLGMVLHDKRYGGIKNTAILYRAFMNDGVVKVPELRA